MNTQQIPREQQTRDSVPAPVAAGNELVLFQISAYLQVMCLYGLQLVLVRDP